MRNGYVISKVFCIKKLFFEVLEWFVDVRFIRLRIVIIYRLFFLFVYLVLISTFFVEFFDYFEFVMFNELLVFLGNFNIYVDVFIDMDVI